jgi:hypothetical protein
LTPVKESSLDIYVHDYSKKSGEKLEKEQDGGIYKKKRILWQAAALLSEKMPEGPMESRACR